MQKLQASIQFARGDVASYNALADAYAGWAERLPDNEAMQKLSLALEQGYQAALHVNASSCEAFIGIAEVKGKMGRLCQQNGSSNTLQAFQESAQAYQRALQNPSKLGSLQERSDIKYNFACMLCLGEQHEAAMNTLSELWKHKSVTIHDLTTDEDFLA